MVFAQFVLICPLHIVTAGLNKKHVLRVAALLEQQNHRGNARAEEQLLRQADDRIQQVLLDERFADAPFAAPRKSTPCGAMTPTRPPSSLALSIMWLMKA